MDAIHYKVKQNNRGISKAAYIVIGINDEGFKQAILATYPEAIDNAV